MNEVEPPDGAGQRRHLTLLFMDLCASSRLAESLEAEQFAAVLATLRRVCFEAIERYRGRVVRMQGDGVLAIFGLPEPAEDDSLRAALAALEVHEGLDAAHRGTFPSELRPLQMHSGLHGGVVLLADGDIERGRFDVIGDAAHTAARLSQLAPPGAILADLDSLGAHARQLSLEAEITLALPGRSLPVRAAAIRARALSARHPAAVGRFGLSPLAGRAHVLLDLASQITALADSGGLRRIDLAGPPGVGKTRLLDELAVLPQWHHWQVLRGQCADSARMRALHPFHDMVGAGDSTLSSDALYERLQSAAAQTRVLLLIDDWQWSDDASRQLLARLLQSVPTICAVLAQRAPQHTLEDSGSARSFALQPLDERASSQIIGRWLPAADPYTVAAIHRQAGGVPLFIEELAQSRLAHRDLVRDSDHPGWLAQLVAARMSLLPMDQQEVIRTGAVLGNAFSPSLLATVGGWRESDLDWAALADGDFLLATADTVRFRHGLTRDAVYNSVALQERRALHRRAVRALAVRNATPAALEALAYHAQAAGLWGEAADYAESAARQAMAAFAMDVARRHYQAALDALERVGLSDAASLRRWCVLVHELGMTCIFDPLALPDVLPIFELGLERARSLGDRDLMARSAYWLGHICFGLGWLRPATRHVRDGLQMARADGNVRLVAQLEATLGQILAAAGDYPAALPLMDGALNAKQRHVRSGSSVAVGSAFTLASKAGVLGDQGDFVLAQAAFDEAMVLAGDSTHPVANSIRSWAMVVLVWQGRWSELVDVSAESARRAHATQALLPLAISHACEGYGRWVSAGDEAGLRKLAAAVQWLQQRQGRFMTSIYHGWLVDALVASGDKAGARLQAAAVLARARHLDSFGMGDACRALALTAAADGKTQRAARWMAYAEHWAAYRCSRREAAQNTLCHARLALLRGDGVAASAQATSAAAAFEDMRMLWHARTARSRTNLDGQQGHGLTPSTAEISASATSANLS